MTLLSLSKRDDTYDVLILGAGAAGLASASSLRKNGKRIKVIEARSRLGGRVFTCWPKDSPFPVELGAEFIHGRPKVLEAFAGVTDPDETQWWLRLGGKLIRRENAFKKIERVYRKIHKELGSREESFDKASRRIVGQVPTEEVELARAFVTGFYAAPLGEVSAQAILASSPTVGDSSIANAFHIRTGYYSVLEPYLADLSPIHETILTEHRVNSVEWSKGRVAFHAISRTGSEETFVARKAILTLPVGCWKKVEFIPPLESKEDSLEGLGMGTVHRVTLRFRSQFWKRGHFHPGYLQNLTTPFVTFWAGRPWPDPRFTCWSGGSQTLGIGPDPVAQSCHNLAKALNVSVARLSQELVEAYYHDWNQDPFSLGAYSFVKVNGVEKAKSLAAPIDDTLFFAGEACHPGDRTGTVDGAIETGLIAANELLASEIYSEVKASSLFTCR